MWIFIVLAFLVGIIVGGILIARKIMKDLF